MADIARMESALRNASKAADAGDPEAAVAAKAIANELKRARSGNANNGPLGQLNRGISSAAEGLGNLGAAIPNAALRGIGKMTGNEDPYQFRPNLADPMRSVGIPVAEGEAQTAGQAFMRGTGEAAAFMLPGSLVAKGAQSLGGVTGKIGGDVARAFGSKAGVGAELVAGGAGRASGQVAEDAGFGPTGQMVAEFGGSVIGGMGPAALNRSVVRPVDDILTNAPGVIGTSYRAIVKQSVPYSGRGARVRASDRLSGLSADPKGQAAALSADSRLSPAQQTGDERLMRLERAVKATDPTAEDAFNAANVARREGLESDIRAIGGSKDDAVVAMEARRRDFAKTMDMAIERAREKASDALGGIPPERNPSANAAKVRNEIEFALTEALDVERQLWAQVPMESVVPTSQSRQILADLVANTGRAQMDDVPAKARALLGNDGLGDQTTVREMHALYSDLRQLARNSLAGTNPNPNRARMANRIADAILDDLGATSNVRGEVGETINAARMWSRELHEKFDQGTVGDILRRTNAGSDRVANELTLSGLDSGDIKAKVTMADIRKAIGNRGDLAAEDYLKSRFESTAVRNGELNLNSANAFLRRNREVLEAFPDLEVSFRAAVKTAERAKTVAKSAGERAKIVADPKRSPGAAFVGADYGKEIEKAVFQTRDPARAAAMLKREAARDPSGKALDGVKGSILDYMIERGARGESIPELLRDRRIGGAARVLLSPEEFNRLGRLGAEMDKLALSETAGALPSVVDDTANTVMTYAARIIAARHGAALGGSGGASIQTANMASSRMKALLGKLTSDQTEAILRDAMNDRELFAALLLKENMRGPAAKKAETRLIEWLAGYTATQVSADE